ncbi:Tetraspanin-10 like protein [Argiope bruennichi]|uniref:Tetraspanin-10 like protein n=1 Tax=Argiope bruennichi TaxID=94029 RepID=A0A8T0FAW2_ARGBR|nr:Tetraspanin-10 like protein [Argiope bruennichi]
MSTREMDTRFKRFFLRRKRGPRTPWEDVWSLVLLAGNRTLLLHRRVAKVQGARNHLALRRLHAACARAGDHLRFGDHAQARPHIASHEKLNALFFPVSILKLCQILYVCLVLESVAGAVAIALDTTARDDAFYEALLRDVERNYGREPKITFAIDKMQIAFNCCGVDGPENWPETLWARNVLVEDSAGHLPLSCCGKDVHRCNEANDALRKKKIANL